MSGSMPSLSALLRGLQSDNGTFTVPAYMFDCAMIQNLNLLHVTGTRI